MNLKLIKINREIIKKLNEKASLKGYDNYFFSCYIKNLTTIYCDTDFKELYSNTIRKCKLSNRNIENKNYKFSVTPLPIKVITDLYEAGYYPLNEDNCYLVIDEDTEDCLRGLDLNKYLYDYPIILKTI